MLIISHVGLAQQSDMVHITEVEEEVEEIIDYRTVLIQTGFQ